MPTFRSNNRGFTLVELMVAMLISLVSMFALLSAVQVANEVNLKNEQREEATQIAGTRMMRFKALPFSSISTSYALELVQPTIRGASGAPPYRVIKSSTNLSSTAKMVDVRVRWVFKNTSSSYEVQSVIHQ